MQKKCRECGEWKPVKEFHRQGMKNGKVQYCSRCRLCQNEINRKKYKKGESEWKHKKAYVRARSRALTRLSKLAPELYQMCLREELEKEGVLYGDSLRFNGLRNHGS